ncbi:MAG: hypothetical protein ACREUS_14155 [Burkholderiales bacterium]
MRQAWLWVLERAQAMKPCRVAIVLVFAGLAFLLLASQGEDVARALAERRSGDERSWQPFWFFAASLAWSLSAWYWARVMLFLKLPGVPEQDPRLLRWRTWVPRALGFLATLGVAAAFYKASRGYLPAEHAYVRDLLRFYAFWCLLGAVAFLVAVSLRRTLARAAYRRLKVEALNLPKAEEQSYGSLSFRELGLLTRALLAIAIFASVVLFVILSAAPNRVAPGLGSAAILLLAAAGWIAAGSTLDFVGMRLRFPVFSALLLVAVAFSFWNDNHAVRTLAEAQPAQRPDVKASLNAWLARHDATLKRTKERIPLYLVNAEGGGIRAAYWTVTVLGEIHKRRPGFAEHLFSLSGVSGGSLGASVFVALLAQARDGGAPFELKEKAQDILSEDFLSPVVAAMLYPELVQRFLFFPVAGFDRAATLERAWEGAWAQHAPGRNRMQEPLDRLYDDPKEWTPALFLNATWVETGKRIIAANLRVGAAKGAEDFVDIEDAQAFFAPRSVPLSTAAHMSARFTYVSPAGTLVKDGRPHGRVVDGGYFENSGATTTLEILKLIGQLADEDPRWQRVEPYVIHISNDPVEAKYGSDSLASAPDNPTIAPNDFLNEALSPLWTLLNARDARGYYARETLAWHVGHSHFLHFGLCRRSTNVPLGWVLSGSTRERMEQQLRSNRVCTVKGSGAAPVFDNPANLRKIEARLPRSGSTALRP